MFTVKQHMHIKYNNPSYRIKMMFIFVGKYMNLILFWYLGGKDGDGVFYFVIYHWSGTRQI